jgi:hypothetical protein
MSNTEPIQKTMTIRRIDLSPLIDPTEFGRIREKFDAELKKYDRQRNHGEMENEWKVHRALAYTRDDLDNQDEILQDLGFVDQQGKAFTANRKLLQYVRVKMIGDVSALAMSLGLSRNRAAKLARELKANFNANDFRELKSGGATKSRTAKGEEWYKEWIDWDVAKRFHCKVHSEDVPPDKAATLARDNTDDQQQSHNVNPHKSVGGSPSQSTTSPRQPDPHRKKQVEQNAVNLTIRHYQQQGYVVDSVELDNVGWDLEAIRDPVLLRIEVKGLSGQAINIELTPNEYDKMGQYKESYRICVVTNALGSTPQFAEFSFHDESGNWQDNGQRVLEITEVVAARCRAEM